MSAVVEVVTRGFISYALRNRDVAEPLAARLRGFGYEAPAIELVVERAPQTTQIRVHGKSGRSYARWLNRVVTELTTGQPTTTDLHNAKPRTDTFEIWFSKRLCAPGEKSVTGCGGG